MPVLGSGREGHYEPTDELLQFLQHYADSPSKFQLLFFLARHPNASFEYLILASALWVRLPELREALSALIDSALVEQTDENGLTLYRLAQDPLKRGQVLALAGLT